MNIFYFLAYNAPFWSIFLDDFYMLCLIKGEHKKFLKNLLTSYAIILGQRTFFSIIKLVFRGKREFYLFFYNAIFKDCILTK